MKIAKFASTVAALFIATSLVAFALSGIIESGLPSMRLFLTMLVVCFVLVVVLAAPLNMYLYGVIKSPRLRAILAGAACGVVPAVIAFIALLQGGTLLAHGDILSADGVPTVSGMLGVLKYLGFFSFFGAVGGGIYFLVHVNLTPKPSGMGAPSQTTT